MTEKIHGSVKSLVVEKGRDGESVTRDAVMIPAKRIPTKYNSSRTQDNLLDQDH